jgi:hypothetical protein
MELANGYLVNEFLRRRETFELILKRDLRLFVLLAFQFTGNWG